MNFSDLTNEHFPMLTFVNTRPTVRAAALSNSLRQIGVTVLDIPLLALTLNHDALITPPTFQQYQAIVVISPTAASAFMDCVTSANCPHDSTPIIAVGKTTAHTLKALNHPIITPEIESSEGIVSLPALQSLNLGDRILVVRGDGGRKLLDQHMFNRGVHLGQWLVYTRSQPNQLMQQCATLQNVLHSNSTLVVLISSVDAWNNWLKATASLVGNCHLIVLGDRTTRIVHSYIQESTSTQKNTKKNMLHYQSLSTLTDLSPDTISQAIRRLL